MTDITFCSTLFKLKQLYLYQFYCDMEFAGLTYILLYFQSTLSRALISENISVGVLGVYTLHPNVLWIELEKFGFLQI